MSTDVAVTGSEVPSRFQTSLQAELAAERDLVKSVVMSILIALPVSIGVFVLITALAFSDKADWYVWLGLGVGIGALGALLMGALAGATLNAHKLDDVDRETFG